MESQKPPLKLRVRWWQWPNVLGLDAPLVALGWMALFARSYSLQISLAWPQARFWFWDSLSFGMGAWFVYLLDRLVDSYSENPPVAVRHQFTRRHRPLLMVLAAVALATALYGTLWQVSAVVLVVGVPLFIGMVLYFGVVIMQRLQSSSQHGTILVCSFMGAVALFAFREVGGSFATLLARLWFVMGFAATLLLALQMRHDDSSLLTLPKRLLCGYLFAAGCALIPSTRGADLADSMAGEMTMLLAMVCSLNTLGISIWEAPLRPTGQQSGPEISVIRWLWPLGAILSAAACGFLLAAPLPWMRPFCLACLISLVILCALHLLRRLVSPPLLRVLSDAALLTPFAVLPLFDLIQR